MKMSSSLALERATGCAMGTNASGRWAPPTYHRSLIGNMVHLSGVVQGPVKWNQTNIIAILPPGYRPSPLLALMSHRVVKYN